MDAVPRCAQDLLAEGQASKRDLFLAVYKPVPDLAVLELSLDGGMKSEPFSKLEACCVQPFKPAAVFGYVS